MEHGNNNNSSNSNNNQDSWQPIRPYRSANPVPSIHPQPRPELVEREEAPRRLPDWRQNVSLGQPVSRFYTGRITPPSTAMFYPPNDQSNYIQNLPRYHAEAVRRPLPRNNEIPSFNGSFGVPTSHQRYNAIGSSFIATTATSYMHNTHTFNNENYHQPGNTPQAGDLNVRQNLQIDNAGSPQGVHINVNIQSANGGTNQETNSAIPTLTSGTCREQRRDIRDYQQQHRQNNFNVHCKPQHSGAVSGSNSTVTSQGASSIPSACPSEPNAGAASTGHSFAHSRLKSNTGADNQLSGAGRKRCIEEENGPTQRDFGFGSQIPIDDDYLSGRRKIDSTWNKPEQNKGPTAYPRLSGRLSSSSRGTTESSYSQQVSQQLSKVKARLNAVANNDEANSRDLSKLVQRMNLNYKLAFTEDTGGTVDHDDIRVTVSTREGQFSNSMIADLCRSITKHMDQYIKNLAVKLKSLENGSGSSGRRLEKAFETSKPLPTMDLMDLTITSSTPELELQRRSPTLSELISYRHPQLLISTPSQQVKPPIPSLSSSSTWNPPTKRQRFENPCSREVSSTATNDHQPDREGETGEAGLTAGGNNDFISPINLASRFNEAISIHPDTNRDNEGNDSDDDNSPSIFDMVEREDAARNGESDDGEDLEDPIKNMKTEH